MTSLRSFMTVAALGAVGTASWYVGSGLVQNVRHARAVEQVEVAREQLNRLDDLAGVFKAVGKAVEPSVVFIEVTKKGAKSTPADIRKMFPFDDDTLRKFFPDRDGDGEPDLPDNEGNFDQQGQGSGVIMESNGSSGWILTNNHVAGSADEIKVTLADGREIKSAKVIGTDPKTDLAVVQIESDRLIAANWADSDKIEKGDIVMAFGAPFGYVGSMTHGIVSALNRNDVGILASRQGYENFIQTDCPINPGNSGGPLVNTRGQVVGINTAILSRTGGFQGVGFAIPANQAKFVYEQLRQSGKVTRGWLGVGINDLARKPGLAESFGYTGTRGVLIEQVMDDGPAAGKLEEGDIVISVDGRPTANMQQLRNYVAGVAPGTTTTLKVYRENRDKPGTGAETEVKIKIGEQPENLVTLGGSKSAPGRNSDADSPATAEKLGLRLTDPSAAALERFGLEQDAGALVLSVNRNSPAFRAGVQAGDLITRIGNKEVTDVDTALEALAAQDASKGYRLYVTSRAGKRFVLVPAE